MFHGPQYAWYEQPSYELVTGIIRTMYASEEKLLHSISLMLKRHPAMINSRDRRTGVTLLQHMVETVTLAPMLGRILKLVDCPIGLMADKGGSRQPILSALEQGRWSSLRPLLVSLLSGKIAGTPQTFRLLSTCFIKLARTNPRDFLHFIENMPLHPEPEVLSPASPALMHVRCLTRLFKSFVHLQYLRA